MRNEQFFDSNFSKEEQLPRKFFLSFSEISLSDKKAVKVMFNEERQVGNVITDNAYEDDFYRYHDIFHYSFATLLGWSPCTRALLKCKRKSSSMVDEVEDGARAIITEEAISLIIFNESKKKHYFKNKSRVSKSTLKFIKSITDNLEVKLITSEEWEQAILRSYQVFRLLIDNKGGKVEFDSINKEIKYFPLA